MKKEYCILCIYGNGTPFYLDTFDSIEKAKLKLYEMIALEQERGRPYYVNNDFYNNEYTQNVKGKYFCIKERNVSNWVQYFDSNLNTNVKNYKSNIIHFNNYL